MQKKYTFLLIEDSHEDSSNFEETIERLNKQEEDRQYALEVAKSYEEGIEKISSIYNGIIVDIKLNGEHDGNDIVEEIRNNTPVPIVIFTGTPDVMPIRGVKIYKKGETYHEDIIRDLCAVNETGIFNVLGRTGLIEKAINKIFWDNLYPQIELWKAKQSQGIATEKVLLRYALSHVQELIDTETPSYFTEEMYICPPVEKGLKTGSIIQCKEDKSYRIVLSPPCDLAFHNGAMKTDRILLCEIESQEAINAGLIESNTTSKKGQSSNKKAIKKAIKNNYTDYYHWLPKNSLFEGGYINFRKIAAYSPKEVDDLFTEPLLKIQQNFVKNILNRFSSYYARQGQPDFDFENEAEKILNGCQALDENKSNS